MPYVFQDGMLEAQEVNESMQQLGQELNQAHQERHAFLVVTDPFDDPVLLRIDTITKITVNP